MSSVEEDVVMDILFTGFEPFGGEKINPSWESVSRLPDSVDGVRIHKLRLPVEYHNSIRAVQAEFAQINPDAVVMTGQAGGRKGITVERVAINIDDADVPDNAGAIIHDGIIRRGAPNAYFSTLPIKDIVRTLGDAGIEAHVSNTAGTYVCNHIMFGMLDYINMRMLQTRAGFIHLPFIPEQCIDRPNTPSMSLDDMTNALLIIARALIK